MKLRLSMLVFAFTSACLGNAQAQTSSVKQTAATSMQDTDLALQTYLNHPTQGLASLSVIAIKQGKIVYEKQFGRRLIHPDDAKQDLPANDQSLYRIASVSKMVAAVGAMLLVEQGKLDLDSDISQYLGFLVRNPHFPDATITTRMLLSHQSSLRDDAGYSFPLPVTLQSFLQVGGSSYGDGSQWDKASAVSSHAPGHFFRYVNLNWVVLGSVMEAASGQRFDHFMRDHLLRPVGMVGGYNPEELSPQELSNVAVLYRKKKEHDTVWNPTGPWIVQVDDYRGKAPVKRDGIDGYVLASNASLFAPQGGLRTTVHSLGRLMQMLMNHGEIDGKRILKADSIQQLLKVQWRYDATTNNGDHDRGLFLSWSLGFQGFTGVSAPSYGDSVINPSAPNAKFSGFGHLGEAYGLNSGFMFDPITRNGMIYAIGGLSADSEALFGEYSSLSPWEEKILTALYAEIVR